MYLKRKLSESLSSFKSLHFPQNKCLTSSLRYEVTLGVGGNIKDVRRRFEHLLVIMQRDKRIFIYKTSLILKNPPFGFLDQDDFFNSIIVLRTNMQPSVFLQYLMRLEKKLGRRRSFANAPRTLDLDIIFFANKIINTKKLTIPHAHWSERDSVLIPLSSIQ